MLGLHYYRNNVRNSGGQIPHFTQEESEPQTERYLSLGGEVWTSHA